MLVIGLTVPWTHDSAVAAILDGRLVFAAEEERFTRHKHSLIRLPNGEDRDEPPINALAKAFSYLKNKYGVTPDDVTAYAVNFDIRLYPGWVSQGNLVLGIITSSIRFGYYLNERDTAVDLALSRLGLRAPATLHKYLESMIRAAVRLAGLPAPGRIKIIDVRHHLAHAASAYYFSGFNSASVIVIDGSGERDVTTIWRAKNGDFELLSSLTTQTISIGWLWDSVSEHVGFNWLEGPGKVMGLTAYGKNPSPYLNRLLELFDFDNDEYPYGLTELGKELHKKGPWERKVAEYVTGGKVPWDPRGPMDQRAADVALAIQEFTNRLFVRLGEWAKRRTGEDKVALAGGVALNARANMELYYSKIFNDMFIFPAANDAGTAIGAAAYVYEHVLGGKMANERLQHVYFGPEYSDEEIKRAVERSRFKAEYIGDDVNVVADLVAKGMVVTWYEGRAELGPRALGHRSILADPRRKDYWKLVNDIKGREWWRPLAPSLLLSDAPEYFKDPTHHPFMILMFRFRDKEACERVPVVCHVDMTARPQTVTGNEDRNWYNLIKAFKDLTGEGLVMNTSFNLAGEPLVETPQDAIKSFALGGFDAMYMQGWLIRKR